MSAGCFSVCAIGRRRARFAIFAFRLVALGCFTLTASLVALAAPQEVQPLREPRLTGATRQAGQVASATQPKSGNPTPLAALIDEAEKNDPTILASKKAAEAATHVAPQVSTHPDPQFTLQQFSVGSPRPFAGYTNSDFAYIGLGASQQLLFPGKLKLRGEVANRDADVAKAHTEVVSRDEIEKLKATYFQLAYLQQTLGILERDQAFLRQMEQQAEAHYSAGQGNQQAVLKAQLEQTKILREISMHHELVGEAQAELKRLVRRAQDSEDIVTEPLPGTFLRYTSRELLDKVRGEDPNIQEQSAMIERDQSSVKLARKEFRPDFDVSYMWERTDPTQYRAYYMATFEVNFPRRKPREAALAEAQINVERGEQELDAELQSALAEVQKQYVIAKTSEEQMVIYRDGLIPQARAAIQAGLAEYQSNRENFETLFSSFLDVLNLDLEYQQTLLDHQTALVHIERLTGVTLP